MCLAPQRRAIFPPFLDLWTSKSGPYPSVFWHFDLKMRFSLQRRAIFRPRNFKKRSAPEVLCTFSLENVLRATAACNFSTSQLQKVVRDRQFFTILTWKCAPRHSGVQFFHIATSKSGPRPSVFYDFDLKMCFIATSKSAPSLQCFTHFDVKMCFSLQRRAIFHVSSQQPPPHPPLYRGYFSTQATHKSLKNTAFRDFPNISRNCSFFLLTFAQLYLLSSDSTSLLNFFIFWLCCSALLFQLSILSEVRLLNFLRWYSQTCITHYVESADHQEECPMYDKLSQIWWGWQRSKRHLAALPAHHIHVLRCTWPTYSEPKLVLLRVSLVVPFQTFGCRVLAGTGLDVTQIITEATQCTFKVSCPSHQVQISYQRKFGWETSELRSYKKMLRE